VVPAISVGGHLGGLLGGALAGLIAPSDRRATLVRRASGLALAGAFLVAANALAVDLLRRLLG